MAFVLLTGFDDPGLQPRDAPVSAKVLDALHLGVGTAEPDRHPRAGLEAEPGLRKDADPPGGRERPLDPPESIGRQQDVEIVAHVMLSTFRTSRHPSSNSMKTLVPNVWTVNCSPAGTSTWSHPSPSCLTD